MKMKIAIAAASVLATMALLSLCPFSCVANVSRAKRATCASHLMEIGKALKMHSMDGCAYYATSLQELVPGYVVSAKTLVCPGSGHQPGSLSNVTEWCDYVYVVGLRDGISRRSVHGYCPPENHGGEGGNILFLDGSVEWFAAEDFLRIVEEGVAYDGR